MAPNTASSKLAANTQRGQGFHTRNGGKTRKPTRVTNRKMSAGSECFHRIAIANRCRRDRRSSAAHATASKTPGYGERRKSSGRRCPETFHMGWPRRAPKTRRSCSRAEHRGVSNAAPACRVGDVAQRCRVRRAKPVHESEQDGQKRNTPACTLRNGGKVPADRRPSRLERILRGRARPMRRRRLRRKHVGAVPRDGGRDHR